MLCFSGFYLIIIIIIIIFIIVQNPRQFYGLYKESFAHLKQLYIEIVKAYIHTWLPKQAVNTITQ